MSSPAVPSGQAAPPVDQRIYAVPLVVAVAFMMESIDQTIITASIPAMAHSLAVTPLSLNLAITSYLLSLAVGIPISGWFADRFGARRVFLSAMVVFTLGSILCGAANSLGELVAARMMQGVGGALMTPVGRLILLRSVSRENLVVAIAYMTTPVLLGPLIGPILGGVITTYLDWRWIFYINVPVGILGIILTLMLIRDFEPAPRRAFDFGGFLLCGSALVALQISVENFVHPFLPTTVAIMLPIGALLAAILYGRIWRRRASPVLDLSLFGGHAFRTGVLFGGISRIGLNAVPFMVQLQLQLGFGYSPIHAGLTVFATAFGALALKPFLKSTVKRLGYRKMLSCNAVLVAATTAGLYWLNPAWPQFAIIGYLFVYGLLRTAHFNAINALIYSDVPPSKESAGVSVGGVAQQVFIGLGISLSAAATTLLAGGHAPRAGDFAPVFLFAAIVLLLGGSGFLLLPRASDHKLPAARLPDPEPEE